MGDIPKTCDKVIHLSLFHCLNFNILGCYPCLEFQKAIKILCYHKNTWTLLFLMILVDQHTVIQQSGITKAYKKLKIKV